MTKQSRKKSRRSRRRRSRKRRSRRRRSRKRRSRKRRSRKRRSRKRIRFYMKRKRHNPEEQIYFNPFTGYEEKNKYFQNLKIIDITNKIIEKIKFKNKRQKDIFINAQKSPGGLLDPIIQNRTWQGKKLKYMALEVLMNPTYLAERNMMSPSFPVHKKSARKLRRSKKK